MVYLLKERQIEIDIDVVVENIGVPFREVAGYVEIMESIRVKCISVVSQSDLDTNFGACALLMATCSNLFHTLERVDMISNCASELMWFFNYATLSNIQSATICTFIIFSHHII